MIFYKSSAALVIAMSCLAPSGSVQAAGELEATLLQDYPYYNESCRGRDGSDSDTFKACGVRDYAGWLLNSFGWC